MEVFESLSLKNINEIAHSYLYIGDVSKEFFDKLISRFDKIDSIEHYLYSIEFYYYFLGL